MNIDFHAQLENEDAVVKSLRGKFTCSSALLMDEVFKRANEGAKLRVFSSDNELMSIFVLTNGKWRSQSITSETRKKSHGANLFYHRGKAMDTSLRPTPALRSRNQLLKSRPGHKGSLVRC